MLADGDGVADIDPAARRPFGIEAAVGTHGELGNAGPAVANPAHRSAGSGRRRERCRPGPRAAGPSARRRCRRRRPTAGDSPAAGSRVACALLGQSVGRRRWWSPGQWSGARRRVPPRPAKPGPATRGSPGRVDGSGPTGSWRRKVVVRVDGAFTVPPGCWPSPRCATHRRSMQSPPASADRVIILRSGGSPNPGASGRGTGATSSGRPRCRVQGGRKEAIGIWPPSGGRRR